MTRKPNYSIFLTGLVLILGAAILNSSSMADTYNGEDETMQPIATDSSQKELMEAKEALDSMSGLEELKPKETQQDKKRPAKKSRPAEAFVVGPDWEFDGFVAGGQDQAIKGMFSVNDLVYLNVGYGQGLSAGDRVGIFRRGDQIRDPQTSRVIGFEVRKIGISEVSDRIESDTCSVRIIKSYEAVEIGDLARRED